MKTNEVKFIIHIFSIPFRKPIIYCLKFVEFFILHCEALGIQLL